MVDTLRFLLLAAAIASISFTLSTQALFAPLRDSVKSWPVLSYMINCTYCLSHWVAIVLLAASGWRLPYLNTFTLLFALIFASNVLSYSLRRLMR